jgi:hypothetical protein
MRTLTVLIILPADTTTPVMCRRDDSTLAAIFHSRGKTQLIVCR